MWKRKTKLAAYKQYFGVIWRINLLYYTLEEMCMNLRAEKNEQEGFKEGKINNEFLKLFPSAQGWVLSWSWAGYSIQVLFTWKSHKFLLQKRMVRKILYKDVFSRKNWVEIKWKHQIPRSLINSQSICFYIVFPYQPGVKWK